MSKGFKKVLIVFTYLVIFVLFIYGLISLLSPEENCFDGKQNQNESGIDCGGVCAACEVVVETKDLVVSDENFVFGGNETYDVVFEVQNPNDLVGGKNISYRAVIKDESGNELDSKTEKGFILPIETKHFVVLGLKSQTAPSSVEIEIVDVDWEKFVKFQKPQLRIFNKQFGPLENQVGSQAYGVLKNESDFEFGNIRIVAILRSVEGLPVGVNVNQIQTVRPGEERDFKFVWPYELPGDVVGLEMEAEANVYNSENYTSSYIGG